MASYATVASASASAPAAGAPPSTVVSPTVPKGAVTDLQKELAALILCLCSPDINPPDALLSMVDSLRNDMEIPQGSQPRSAGRFSGGSRNFSQANQSNWRGNRFQGATHTQTQAKAFDTRPTDSFATPRSPAAARPVGRYQSKFTTTGNINDKILNTVIGNKLNSFTPITYNDTRDFIYQIMDSGEKEFIKDFIEKVFAKATVEELYCALFAKLIAEIAHRYPVMYEEMTRYHEEFLKIFEDVLEGDDTNSDLIIKQRQYRLGYGQFISELASLNALEKHQLLAMVEKVMDKIWVLSAEDDKTKTVEEFIDCLIRLTKSLREKSPAFFASVKGDMNTRIIERVTSLIHRSAGARVSLSAKARFGLMDLKDIL